MNDDVILNVRDLTKIYRQTQAVKGITFTVRRNEIVGLLGPNGAGKTTTINMLLSVLAPTAGTITIAGLDLATQRTAVLKKMNFAAVYAPLPGNLTVYQNLYVFGLLYGVAALPERIDDLLRRYELDRFRNTRCGVLSSGEQTRVGLAKAMLNEPDLLLLDEPTASLDPSVAQDIRACIRDFVSRKQCGVLWTSHNMHEVEVVCDRVLFMSHGEILLRGDPHTLPQEYGKTDLEDLFIAVAREPLSLEGR